MSGSTCTTARTQAGPGVDELLDVCNLVEKYGACSFDVLLSTEVIEHVRDWRRAIWNMKTVLRPGGWLLLTTRSPGFRIHDYPHDYWRFEKGDIPSILRDFTIGRLEEDPIAPGVFLLAQRNTAQEALDLSYHRLYSVARCKRIRNLSSLDILLYHIRLGTLWRVKMLRHATLRGIIRKRLAFLPFLRAREETGNRHRQGSRGPNTLQMAPQGRAPEGPGIKGRYFAFRPTITMLLSNLTHGGCPCIAKRIL